MKIGFIGCGKAANSLARYFNKNGKEVVSLYDLDNKKAIDLANGVGSSADSLDELIEKSQMIFLSVNDSSINNLWEEIKKTYDINGKVFIHNSGALEGVYGDYNLFALHPASPLTGNGGLEGVVFGLEEHEENVVIKDFIESMGNNVVSIPQGQKAKYHLANVIVSNLALSLFDRGVKNLIEIGLSEEDALNLLLPLAKQNLVNIGNKGIKASVTGPVQRGDKTTVDKHLEVISEKDKGTYIDLSSNIEDILDKKTNRIF